MADHQCLPTLSPHGKGRTGPQSNGPQLGRFPVVAVLGKDCRGRGQCGIQNSVDLAVSPLRLLPAAVPVRVKVQPVLCRRGQQRDSLGADDLQEQAVGEVVPRGRRHAARAAAARDGAARRACGGRG